MVVTRAQSHKEESICSGSDGGGGGGQDKLQGKATSQAQCPRGGRRDEAASAPTAGRADGHAGADRETERPLFVIDRTPDKSTPRVAATDAEEEANDEVGTRGMAAGDSRGRGEAAAKHRAGDDAGARNEARAEYPARPQPRLPDDDDDNDDDGGGDDDCGDDGEEVSEVALPEKPTQLKVAFRGKVRHSEPLSDDDDTDDDDDNDDDDDDDEDDESATFDSDAEPPRADSDSDSDDAKPRDAPTSSEKRGDRPAGAMFVIDRTPSSSGVATATAAGDEAETDDDDAEDAVATGGRKLTRKSLGERWVTEVTAHASDGGGGRGAEQGDEAEDDEEEERLHRKREALLRKKLKKKAKQHSLDPGAELVKYGGSYLRGASGKPTVRSIDPLLARSVLAGGVEKRQALPMRGSKREARKARKAERARTAGAEWFDMTAPEVTPEVAQGFAALRLRGVGDAKRFYKKADRAGAPTHFQLARVVDNPIDFFHARVPRRDRKRTLVEELLADATVRSYTKRKVQEIVGMRAAGKDHSGKHKKKQQRKKQGRKAK